MLSNVQIVMVRTRFPENIGMAARACANMGVENITLVNPELWAQNQKQENKKYVDKAKNLATSAGIELINQIKTASSLAQAVAEDTICIGTTARTGGWRQGILTPEAAAQIVWQHLLQNGRVALVFGSEDKGLENHDIELCTHLVSIPTSLSAASLNLAQAILILLYELRKAMPKQLPQKLPQQLPKQLPNQLPDQLPNQLPDQLAEKHPGLRTSQQAEPQTHQPQQADQPEQTAQQPEQTAQQAAQQNVQLANQQAGRSPRQGRVKHSPLITLQQQELLISHIKQAMQALGSLPELNTNYFLLPIRRFVSRSQVRHNEFSMLMGICNKIMRLSKLNEQKELSQPANTPPNLTFDLDHQTKHSKQD